MQEFRSPGSAPVTFYRCRAFPSERGAILVQAAVCSLVVLAFASFVIDYGILWVSRSQAQNAADAGAAAGAVARAYDDFADPPSPTGVAAQSASQVAQINLVWNQPGTPVVSFDCPIPRAGGQCVRVDVYRDGEFGSTTLPTLFAPLLNITSQGVRATATVEVKVGNATDCLRPLAIPDQWVDNRPPSNVFNKYVEPSPWPGTLLVPNDVYPPPAGLGNGLTTAADLGTALTLTFGNPDAMNSTDGPISPGWFLPLELPGAASYQDNIDTCNGQLIPVGQLIPTWDSSMAGPTQTELTNLVAQDPGAQWVGGQITGSCAPGCAPLSPRLIALAVFDPDLYQQMRATTNWSACPPGPLPRCISIVNFVGFFINDVSWPAVDGYLTTYPGLVSTTSPAPDVASSFLKAITFVR